MNRSLARRAGPFLTAITGLLLIPAGAVLRGQNVATPPPVQWPAPPLPDGPIAMQGPDGLLYVLTSENPGAVLRLEPIEATTTR